MSITFEAVLTPIILLIFRSVGFGNKKGDVYPLFLCSYFSLKFQITAPNKSSHWLHEIVCFPLKLCRNN